ncbi:MAG TPA: HAMP domain-containing sensor histidine kinase [Lysobacter sp.]|nr:HAMP domain-containing sensor histidine kinase [Lysobacter sp.]
MTEGLPRRIKLAFILQALLASVVITAGVMLAGLAVRHSVLDERLQREADAFWTGRAASPVYPLPRTSTMAGYLYPAAAGDRSAPRYLRELAPGRHRVALPGTTMRADVLVDRRPQGTFYLVFESGHINRAIGLTGLVSLLLSLLATYLVSWWTYRTSKRLVAPVSWLANVVTQWDPRDPDASVIKPHNLPAEAGSEVHRLARALVGLADRVADFVQRERDFTRDASHELRTPLTVIRVATDMMLADPATSSTMLRSLARVQRAGRDMEEVIDAFLILAREMDIAPQSSEFEVRDIVHDQIARIRPMLADKPVAIELIDNGAPRLFGPPHVLAVMVGNLLSNAVHFTDHGSIEVRLSPDAIEVRDSGIGMNANALAKAFDPFYRADITREEGRGMGLSITRRLGDRMGWPVSLQSLPGEGTTATIRFLG